MNNKYGQVYNLSAAELASPNAEILSSAGLFTAGGDITTRYMSDGKRLVPLSMATAGYVIATLKMAPTNGQTIVMPNDQSDRILYLAHVAAIATLTITFPATPRPGQLVDIFTMGGATSLTMNGSPNIQNPQTGLAAGDYFSWRNIEGDIWARRI